MELYYGFILYFIALAMAMPSYDTVHRQLPNDRIFSNMKPDYSDIKPQGSEDRQGYYLQPFEIVFPQRVDRSEVVLDRKDNNITKSRLKENSTHFPHGKYSSSQTEHIYFKLNTQSKQFILTLRPNYDLILPSLTVEYWGESRGYSSNRIFHRNITQQHCYYEGHVVGVSSRVAVSICSGMAGVIFVKDNKYFIEPLGRSTTSKDLSSQPHAIYSGSALFNHTKCAVEEIVEESIPETRRISIPAEIFVVQSNFKDTNKAYLLTLCRYCRDLGNVREEKYNQHRVRKLKGRRKRSISKDRFVKTLVVADKKMVKYHGKENIEAFILSVMNVVAKLYRDASIGNAINIVVNRLIFLNEEQQGLRISNHADKTLQSFCKWQQMINPPENSDSLRLGIARHDNAILLTRYDICSHKDEPCGTLGLAPVAGMCEPDRSCSIVQDIGLATAFTIAHEMGHNFGMQHDGAGNDCGLPGSGKPAKIMASQLTENADPFAWSQCSRDYITAFLDSGRGSCLDNTPPDVNMQALEGLPGESADATLQCQWQFGPASTVCKGEEMCLELYCTNAKNECVTNNIPAADGTPCHQDKLAEGWCFEGNCVEKGFTIDAIDGAWGEWSAWGKCSRSCGGGVASSERECTNPRPRHGGKYCIGERKRYRSCNIEDCPVDSPDFRDIQCALYDSVPFRGRFYKWKPFTGGAQNKPCALNCMAEDYNFYTERAPQVIDGTRCYSDSFDICISGECRHVGCDHILGSNAIEDVCRVCNGDGTSCQTVRGHINDKFSNLTDNYKEVLRIPQGAINVMIKETYISRNYLVLQTAADGEFHINGAWTIDWPRKVQAAGTVFQYDRPARQTESLYALGPLKQEVIILLLLQEDNLGLDYEYHTPKLPGELFQSPVRTRQSVEFDWAFLTWTECSLSCATGTSISVATCLRVSDDRIVSDEYCRNEVKPEPKARQCNTHACPPQWKIGEWSSCSQTCGTGVRFREVACVRRTSLGEEIVELRKCHGRKPRSRSRCHKKRCPPEWIVGRWSDCQSSCGEGVRHRDVYCLSPDGNYVSEASCNATLRPAETDLCYNRACPAIAWITGAWQECNVKCGRGVQRRNVTCQTSEGKPSEACPHWERPYDVRECHGPCLPQADGESCEDVEKVNYCPLVLQFNFCSRPYFHHMCCQTCRAAGFLL